MQIVMKLFRSVVTDPGARALILLTAGAWMFVVAAWAAYELLADTFCVGGEFKSDWCPDHSWVTPLLGWSTVGAIGLLGICIALGIALLPAALAHLARLACRAATRERALK
jgi:hypothetical protein